MHLCSGVKPRAFLFGWLQEVPIRSVSEDPRSRFGLSFGEGKHDARPNVACNPRYYQNVKELIRRAGKSMESIWPLRGVTLERRNFKKTRAGLEVSRPTATRKSSRRTTATASQLHRLRANRNSVGEHVGTHRITRVAQMWMPDFRRPRGRPKTASAPSVSNRRCHRLMALVEQNRTAPMVARGRPSARSSSMWARCPTAGSGGPAVVVEQVLAFRRGQMDTGPAALHSRYCRATPVTLKQPRRMEKSRTLRRTGCQWLMAGWSSAAAYLVRDQCPSGPPDGIARPCPGRKVGRNACTIWGTHRHVRAPER